MKIPELAKKLKLTPPKLRKELIKLGFDLGKKSKSIKDEDAEKIIEKLTPKLEKENKESLDKDEKTKKEKDEKEKKEKKLIEITDVITVKDFASKLEYPVTELMSILIKNGIMANINEAIDFETASIIAQDLEFDVKKVEETNDILAEAENNNTDLQIRPPVVTIIGHVDHGKTSLLDKIREESVVSTESGGITQAISSYQIEIKQKKQSRKITFIDTPGHEAFAAMRAHGVKITDIAILVVAADDSVKPQTIEAANFAKSAGVPIVVAINKIDKPGADVNKVKKDLSEIGLSTEDWGGSTIAIEVSAKTGAGIENLLEMILAVFDLDPQKASFEGLTKGVVIESHKDPKVGSTATVLIQNGVLNISDTISTGKRVSKIRSMVNDKGEKIKAAYPSDPVQIIGLEEVPKFGENLYSFSSEKKAQKYTQEVIKIDSAKSLVKSEIGLGSIAEDAKAGKLKELNIIIRADVTGSAEAIKDSLSSYSGKGVKINILASGAGNITDTDIQKAAATKALVLAFKTRPTSSAMSQAKETGVKIATYDVIYQLIDDVVAAIEGLLEPEIVETKTGKARVLAMFRTTKAHKIVGAKLTTGFVEKGEKVLIYKDKTKTGEAIVESLQKGPENLTMVETVGEYGIGLDTTSQIETGDKLTFIKTEERMRKLRG